MSTILTRYLHTDIDKDLQEKMVFLGGPRQVGKTTLSMSLLNNKLKNKEDYYFNWDLRKHRDIIKNLGWPINSKRVIFDEIHKNRSWKNLVKGIYDTHKDKTQFLVTGSARLNTFKKGGDSLLGRYYYYRLHPFSLSEMGGEADHLKQLFEYGGFPDPLIKANTKNHKRWQQSRLERLIKEDLRDLTRIRDLDKVETLAETLPHKVGSPLSLKALSEDLEVDFKTIKNWILQLDHLYYCFLLSPFGSPKIRAVKKEKKLYLWDWSQISDHGPRFENLVASHLLKYCHYLTDTEGSKTELRYLKDTGGREVDFVVMVDNKPKFAVECKSKFGPISKNIHYFSKRTQIPKFYQVHFTGDQRKNFDEKITALSFQEFAKIQNLV